MVINRSAKSGKTRTSKNTHKEKTGYRRIQRIRSTDEKELYNG